HSSVSFSFSERQSGLPFRMRARLRRHADGGGTGRIAVFPSAGRWRHTQTWHLPQQELLMTQITISKPSSGLWTATFSNPPINLIDPDTIGELQDLVAALESDAEVK